MAGWAKRRITLSFEPDIADRIEREADGNVSAWVSELARRELLRAGYQRAAVARADAGLGSEERLAAYARERAALAGYGVENRLAEGGEARGAA